ncbi:MAG: hypothetical protein PWQ77_2181 [Kosmotogales bacterium]|nr:hypothetical protein [Kosmotogales bacterium]
MIEKIMKLLKSAGVTCWKLREDLVESEEFFFIKTKTDIGRAKKVKKFELTVYKDFEENGEKYRGSSAVSLSPIMNSDELKDSIKGAVMAAGFVKNPWYPIVPPYTENFLSPEYELEDLSYDVVTAIMGQKDHSSAWINSAEAFISRNTSRIMNSEGLDVSFSRYKTYIETIVSASGKEEVELYDQFLLSVPKSEMIKKRISKMLDLVEERSNATSTPSLKTIPVILTGEPVKEVMRYYLMQTNANLKYNKISEANIGQSVQGKESGDKITLYILPEVENSYYGGPVDNDGFKIVSKKILDNSVLKNYWGDMRYSYYLDINPTGGATNFKVSPGNLSTNEMRENRHLEVTHFSAVDVDETTGDFGGEIRLGWYFDGSKRIPVYGGSVTGNLKDLKSLYLSKETELEGNYFGPCSLLVEGFNVSGE